MHHEAEFDDGDVLKLLRQTVKTLPCFMSDLTNNYNALLNTIVCHSLKAYESVTGEDAHFNTAQIKNGAVPGYVFTALDNLGHGAWLPGGGGGGSTSLWYYAPIDANGLPTVALDPVAPGAATANFIVPFPYFSLDVVPSPPVPVMMFDAANGSFRSGYTSGTAFLIGERGAQSFASGYDVIASNEQGVCFGNNNDNGGARSSILGGIDNVIDGPGDDVTAAINSTIANGEGNIVTAPSQNAFIAGRQNTVASDNSAICGGLGNFISQVSECFIGGGSNNQVLNSVGGAVVGGDFNSLQGSPNSSVVGGFTNMVIGSLRGSIFGGNENLIQTGAQDCAIINGFQNTIEQGFYSCIFGGEQNTLTSANACCVTGTSGGLITNSSRCNMGSSNADVIIASFSSFIFGGSPFAGVEQSGYSGILTGNGYIFNSFASLMASSLNNGTGKGIYNCNYTSFLSALNGRAADSNYCSIFDSQESIIQNSTYCTIMACTDPDSVAIELTIETSKNTAAVACETGLMSGASRSVAAACDTITFDGTTSSVAFACTKPTIRTGNAAGMMASVTEPLSAADMSDCTGSLIAACHFNANSTGMSGNTYSHMVACDDGTLENSATSVMAGCYSATMRNTVNCLMLGSAASELINSISSVVQGTQASMNSCTASYVWSDAVSSTIFTGNNVATMLLTNGLRLCDDRTQIDNVGPDTTTILDMSYAKTKVMRLPQIAGDASLSPPVPPLVPVLPDYSGGRMLYDPSKRNCAYTDDVSVRYLSVALGIGSKGEAYKNWYNISNTNQVLFVQPMKIIRDQGPDNMQGNGGEPRGTKYTCTGIFEMAGIATSFSGGWAFELDYMNVNYDNGSLYTFQPKTENYDLSGTFVMRQKSQKVMCTGLIYDDDTSGTHRMLFNTWINGPQEIVESESLYITYHFTYTAEPDPVPV